MELHFAIFFGNKPRDVPFPPLNLSVLLFIVLPSWERFRALMLHPVLFIAFPHGFTETSLKPSYSGQQNGGIHQSSLGREDFPCPNFTAITLALINCVHYRTENIKQCFQCLLGKAAFHGTGISHPLTNHL